MYMNIDILKQRPVPQERQQFELLLPEKKAVKIVDKRGDVKIDRESIIQRIRNKVVVEKTEQESSPSPDNTPEPKIDDTEPIQCNCEPCHSKSRLRNWGFDLLDELNHHVQPSGLLDSL